MPRRNRKLTMNPINWECKDEYNSTIEQQVELLTSLWKDLGISGTPTAEDVLKRTEIEQ